MNKYFDSVETLEEDAFVMPDESVRSEEDVRNIDKEMHATQTPRKRLESALEERRLQKELDDFLE
jgi:hypothetical protein